MIFFCSQQSYPLPNPMPANEQLEIIPRFPGQYLCQLWPGEDRAAGYPGKAHCARPLLAAGRARARQSGELIYAEIFQET